MRGASFVSGGNVDSFHVPSAGATHSRSEQSRINGAKSRGPVTEAGKAASSRNALKHGLCSKALLLPGEDPAEFENFVADFCQELSADGTVQTTFAVRAAELAWKLRRLPAVEAAILQSVRVADDAEDAGIGGMGDVLHQLVGKEQDGILLRLQRYETRLERSLHGCLREVRLLKKDAVGSFRSGAVGSFGTPTNADGQQSVGIREVASVVGGSPPAQGPSAARQDDGLAGVRLEAGAMGQRAVGSFGTGAVGSFRNPALDALRKAAVAAAPDVAPWVRSAESARATA